MNDPNSLSEIPFVNQLGDAIEAAISTRPSTRRPRVSRGALLALAAAVALAVAAVAVARVLSSSDELAARSIACYSAPDLGSTVTIIADGKSPTAACAAVLRQTGDPVAALVACSNGSSVAVFPGSDPALCARLKLQPLPAGFAASQAKVARLAAGVAALEARSDCPTANGLAGSVQQLLDRQGWAGWRAEVQQPSRGPCGSVSLLDGGGNRSIQGALDPTRQVVIVSTGAARSTMTLLYGAGGFAQAIERESGRRCYSVATLTAVVEARARSVGRSATVERGAPIAGSLFDARGPRYSAGCAIVTDVRPSADGRNFIAIVPRTR
jgi:hypothetical protein